MTACILFIDVASALSVYRVGIYGESPIHHSVYLLHQYAIQWPACYVSFSWILQMFCCQHVIGITRIINTCDSTGALWYIIISNMSVCESGSS